MTRISKYQLSTKASERIFELFFQVMARARTKDQFSAVIHEILSKTERIMIAKRIAILYLLAKSVGQRSISMAVKVSTGTVSHFARYMYDENGKIKEFIKQMIRDESILHLFEDVFADIFIQPGVKLGHWGAFVKHKKRQEDRALLNE